MSVRHGAAARLHRAVTSPLWLPGWVALGLLVRIALVLHQRGNFAFKDEGDYDSIATALLAGNGFSLRGEPPPFRPPGQVVFLPPIYALPRPHPFLPSPPQPPLPPLIP